jgi:hypothetical protein
MTVRYRFNCDGNRHTAWTNQEHVWNSRRRIVHHSIWLMTAIEVVGARPKDAICSDDEYWEKAKDEDVFNVIPWMVPGWYLMVLGLIPNGAGMMVLLFCVLYEWPQWHLNNPSMAAHTDYSLKTPHTSNWHPYQLFQISTILPTGLNIFILQA